MPFINLFNMRYPGNPNQYYEPILKEIKDTINEFMIFINDQGPIYYNILSFSKNENTMRSTVEGSDYSGKTFINAVPEPPRLIINMEGKFKETLINPKNEVVEENTPVVIIEEEIVETPEEVIEPEIEEVNLPIEPIKQSFITLKNK